MQRSVAGYVRGNLLVSVLASSGAFVAMTILSALRAAARRDGGPAGPHPSGRGDPRRHAVRVRRAVGRLAGGRHPRRLLRRLPTTRESLPGAGDLFADRGDVAADRPARLARRRGAGRSRRCAHRHPPRQRRVDRGWGAVAQQGRRGPRGPGGGHHRGGTGGRPRAASATRRLLGAHVLGANAEEVINVFALAVRQGLTADQVAESVWAYPTSSSDIGCLV